jgi:PKD repeat protein
MKMNEKPRLFAVFVLLIGLAMILPVFGTMTVYEDNNTFVIEEQAEELDAVNIPERTGTRAGSPRTVLAELFTQWNCGPCTYANPAMNELMDTYDSDELVMISYHMSWPPPNNDPYYLYNTPENDARRTYYGVPSVPQLYVDGPPSIGHSGTSSYGHYKGYIDTDLAILSPMTISLEGGLDQMLGIGSVTATIEITDTLPVADLKIRFAVVEDNKYGMGGNLEPRHRYVMRNMLSEEDLPALSIGETFVVSRAFPLDPIFNLDSISIVVFVQNDDITLSRNVLQAATYDFIPQKILVVDDDESVNPYGFEDEYHELLCLMGYAFDGWVYNEKGALTGSELEMYEAVIWLTGDTTSNTLTTADQTAIIDYMDNARGGLFLNGEDIGAEIGGESFFWDYLHSFFNTDTSADTTITGITADPISDPYFAQDLPISGSSPSVIDPWTNASTVFYYSPSFGSAAIKAGHDLDSRVVYFPFMYFEGSDSTSNKRDIMERVLNWLVVQVDYVQIRDSPGDSGNVISTLDLNVGQSQTLWAAAYNHTYGFLENYPISTWRETSGGSLVTISTPGSSSLITAGMAGGSSTLTVDYFGVTNTTTINVAPPTADYLSLTEAPNGIEVTDFSMLASENILLYASSYNNTSGYLGLVDVDWTDSAGLGTFDNTTGTSTTFTAGIVGGLTTITGDLSILGISDSVDITVITAEIDYIQIRNAPGNGGAQVISDFLDVGESREYWCAAYNDTAGYLGDHDSTIWSEDSSGNLIALTGSGESITVTAQLIGGSTTLRSDVLGVLTSAAITVNDPTVDYLQINYEFGPFGTIVVDPIYPVGEEFTYFGAAYNYTALYLYTVPSSSTWTSSNPSVVSVTSPGSSSSITISDTLYGISTLTLNDGLGHNYQTTITVLEPTVDFIRIRSESNGAGDLITSPTYDVGYEVMFYSACYNDTAAFLGDLVVSWMVNDENVGNITPSGGSAQFKALSIGTCLITLEISSVQLITTITVVDETDPTADAGSGGNINEGTIFSFDASGSSDNGVIVDYHWDFGDGNTDNGANPDMDYAFSSPGVYTVTLTVTDAGGNIDSDSITITVWDVTAPIAVAQLPSVPIEDVPLAFGASSSSDNVGIVSYEWDFGDGDTYEGQYKNVTHTYSLPGTYTVSLTVKDAAGYEDYTESQITVLDKTPPGTPKGITVTPLSDGSRLKIEWDPVTDSDLKEYVIYVSENDGGFAKLETITKDKTSHIHTEVTMGNSYKYYIVAFDNSGNDSPQSPIVEGFPDLDTDSDGVFNREDEDDDNDGLTDYQEYEEATDPLNPDTDSDDHLDGEDAFPHDPSEFKDSDFDGVGDREDVFPEDATEWKDTDGDGIGDSADFLPIHNLLFLLIMAIVVIVIVVTTMMMVKRRKAASVSFDGDAPLEQEAESQPLPPDFESQAVEPSKELPPPPKKNLPPPPKRIQK